MSEIRSQFGELQKKYHEQLPKVDPGLIHDLLLRKAENPSMDPIYMVEVFTKPGLNTEQVRSYIIEKTGMSPGIYDNGTHYVTNQKLTLEGLKEISDSDDVLEVSGVYTGNIGGYGASLDRKRDKGEERPYEPRPPATASETVRVPVPSEERKAGGRYMLAIYVAAGIIGAVLIAGLVISGGLTPNVNAPSTPAVDVPGALHGGVTGPTGLPAIGATVTAAEQSTGQTENVFVSLNGQYLLDLTPGTYIVAVYYPDGTNQVVNNFAVEEGSDHQIDFHYGQPPQVD
ncbi:MAG: carboxypeptidase-like regulatory domain-containing protein, partial [Nitrososphaera sp.]|uniref:carboxypeptidase-like regulatory domain-containing protein n=1 Tax=Nitrososphaera sp. TaxID=1971748 RepID=UPI003D6F6E2B